MARIFLSHSSANNAEAVALRDWLGSEGWDDVFLDLDPERGIVAGERWEQALHEAASRCEAVVFLVGRAWLASRWCLKELNLAHRLNKRLFGVLIEDIPVAEVPVDLTATWQLVDLASGSDHRLFRATLPGKAEEAHVTFSASGLTRLRNGLAKAGLDARFFAWPPASEPHRPPYRGLKPLEAEDAGIFFGREAPIIEALDRLRGLREAAAPRFLVILGASGAGKSSFLRAGLLPRLARDDRHFLPLPVIRPDRAVITGETGLVHSVYDALQAQGSRRARADVKAAIVEGAPALSALLAGIAETACPPALPDLAAPDLPAPKPPALVLSIDQGEELFLAEGAEEAERCLCLLRDLVTATIPDVIVLVTIRSDSYERLQMAKALEGIKQETVSLPPVPQGSYADIIEGPSWRLEGTSRALKIEPALTQALLGEIEAGGGKDALPLLAFTLERLYADYGGDGNLRLAEYEELGRIKGSIEAAVESALKAAGADPTIPKDRAAELALLRRGFIPWLAGIDPETGVPRRRVARRSEIPEAARPLVQHLVEQRLLATDVAEDTGEVTIEPAHEALLRQWGQLNTWLTEDAAALAALESVKCAARHWEANGKDASWLTHAGGRLEDALRLHMRPDLAALLRTSDWAYLGACHAREVEAKAREELRRKRELLGNRIIAYGSLTALVVVSALGWFFLMQWREAMVTQSLFWADQAGDHLERGDALTAMLLAIEALPDSAHPRPLVRNRPYVPEAEAALDAAWRAASPRVALAASQARVLSAMFSPDGRRFLTTADDNAVRLWDAETGHELTFLPHDGPVGAVAFSPDGNRVATVSDDHAVRLWEASTGHELTSLPHGSPVRTLALGPGGTHVLTVSEDHAVRLWDAATGRPSTVFAHEAPVASAAFSADGRRVTTASGDGLARVWDAGTGKAVVTVTSATGAANAARFSPDGERVVTASADGGVSLWNASTGRMLAALANEQSPVASAAFSPDSGRILTASVDGSARVWDAVTGRSFTDLTAHRGPVIVAAFSPDGDRVVTTGADGLAHVSHSETGEHVATLGGPGEAVRDAAFSPDGGRIVTMSAGTTARVWDVETGKLLATLAGQGSTLRKTAYSSDGRRVIAIDEDGTAHLWEVFPTAQALVDRAKGTLPHCLTPEQRVAYFLDPDPPVWCYEMRKPPYADDGAPSAWYIAMLGRGWAGLVSQLDDLRGHVGRFIAAHVP